MGKFHYGPEFIAREIFDEKGFGTGYEHYQEIVRCKDCKHAGEPMPVYKNNRLCAKNHQYIRDLNFFCAYGVRDPEQMSLFEEQQ